MTTTVTLLAPPPLLDVYRAVLAGPLFRPARVLEEADVVAGVRYVDDDPVLTAPDRRAGLDLCLHLVRKDHGAAAAADLSAGLHPLVVQRPCTGPL